MRPSRKPSQASLQASARRERANAAARLVDRVPKLTGLEIAVEERRENVSVAETRHVRRIVVSSAPAMFEIPCSDRSCLDGGHDLTFEIMHALGASKTRFQAEHHCNGTVGSASCARILCYIGTATYKP